MFTVNLPDVDSKSALYAGLHTQLAALLEGERDFIANAANTSSLLYHTLPDLNWVGFYIHKEGELVLGPFQGKPACIRIAIGRGVCGAAAASLTTIVVPNVGDFPGHIACDALSNAEIVVPVLAGRRLVAVLDLDSPFIGRFDEEDRLGLEEAVRIFADATDLP